MKLDLDPDLAARARALARAAGEPIVDLARAHTTTSVERAVLRLAGLNGADPDGRPWANHVVDTVRDQVGLEHGVALPVWDALREHGDLHALAAAVLRGEVRFRIPTGTAAREARTGDVPGRSATALCWQVVLPVLAGTVSPICASVLSFRC